jgi:hypothetical protein
MLRAPIVGLNTLTPFMTIKMHEKNVENLREKCFKKLVKNGSIF